MDKNSEIFEIVDAVSLGEYMKIWKWLDWSRVLYDEEVLNLDCIAFGIRDNDRPEAIIIAEINEYAEIKIFNYISHNALRQLMRKFSDYCHSFGISKLIYEFKILEEDETIFKEIMDDNGWSEPQIKYKTYELQRNNVPLLQRTKGNKVEGTVTSFFKTTMKQRCDLALMLPEDSVYFQIVAPESEYCIAYIEEDAINGFVLSEYMEGKLYLQMDKMSANPQAIIGMMCEIDDRLGKNNISKVFVNVKTNYGEQLIKNVFSNQILGSEIIVYNEEK